jgi:hypothetical protein
MKYLFIKEPGNLVPFTKQTEGTLEDLPQALQVIMQDMMKRPELYKQSIPTQSPDADNYSLMIEDAGKQMHFSFRDLAIPGNVFPLIDYLRQKLK